MCPQEVPYGSWRSPITSDLIVAGAVGLSSLAIDGQDIYWIEQRAAEAGRNVLVRRTPDGQTTDLTPAPYNVRTLVHEYDGGAFTVHNGTVYFSNFADQRIYRLSPGAAPEPLTPAPDGQPIYRYADAIVDPQRNRLICIREDHTNPAPSAVVNTIVSIDLAGGDSGQVLVSGSDFYASPRLSPDGSRLAWLTWTHPNMPWDGTELWVGELAADGSIGRTERIAGGKDESIFQPEWSPDGSLYFVSDRTGWWNLYRWRNGQVEPLCERTAEFGLPQWVFGMSTYAIAAYDRIICAFTEQGTWQLASLNTTSGKLDPITTPYSDISGLRAGPGFVVFIGGSATEPASVVHLDLASGQQQVLRRSFDAPVAPGYLSTPQPIEFPTDGGRTAYALFYPPRNQDFAAPEGERPPLLVMSHGGPTAATSSSLNLRTQYWTSRGFAILDVNYGGSTGYGRAYRQRLNGQWGIVDVADCVNGARYLAERGLVDGNRLAIRGSSAGGYTTLAALTFHDMFKAGASHYGISDLEVLATDTHKFESRYLDTLIGPYPERRDIYVARSPIHFTDRLSCPLIVFQGLDDKIVPPNQAEMLVEAVRSKGLPVAYVPFAGEQHGFRQAPNIKRALDGEFYFYSRIFNFTPADAIEPVQIANL